ncbi:Uncharacterised protein [Shigella sonnei]|nr:Uncharacterised protein [Shigella sonnei]
MPVDSKLERNTLTALLNVASWLKRKPGTPELSLERPLFDTEVYVNGEKKIGVLHTDPPKWLDNDHPPFEKHMYGVFMHLRY